VISNFKNLTVESSNESKSLLCEPMSPLSPSSFIGRDIKIVDVETIEEDVLGEVSITMSEANKNPSKIEIK
jgi:hypothetical protein